MLLAEIAVMMEVFLLPQWDYKARFLQVMSHICSAQEYITIQSVSFTCIYLHDVLYFTNLWSFRIFFFGLYKYLMFLA